MNKGLTQNRGKKKRKEVGFVSGQGAGMVHAPAGPLQAGSNITAPTHAVLATCYLRPPFSQPSRPLRLLHGARGLRPSFLRAVSRSMSALEQEEERGDSQEEVRRDARSELAPAGAASSSRPQVAAVTGMESPTGFSGSSGLPSGSMTLARRHRVRLDSFAGRDWPRSRAFGSARQVNGVGNSQEQRRLKRWND